MFLKMAVVCLIWNRNAAYKEKTARKNIAATVFVVNGMVTAGQHRIERGMYYDIRKNDDQK